MEETVRAMNQLIEDNLCFYWGTSEWSPADIQEAYGICDKLGLIKPVVEQCQYNLLHRERFEVEYGELFDKYRMGSTIWSPLAGGILSGKYNNGIPEGSRIANNKNLDSMYNKWVGPQNIEATKKKLQALGEIARSMGVSQAQLALAWTLKNKDVSVCMFGASNLSQVEDNLKAIEAYKKITPEINSQIEEAMQTRPPPAMDYKTWKPLPPRV
jgi:aryl-alcohol dehydrogenase-like predicted oxidoreductase